MAALQVKIALCQLAVSEEKERNIAGARQAIKVRRVPCLLHRLANLAGSRLRMVVQCWPPTSCAWQLHATAAQADYEPVCGLQDAAGQGEGLLIHPTQDVPLR